MGVRSTQPYSLALLAKASAACGDLPEGLRRLARAPRIARGTGERWFEAEIHRLRGDPCVRSGRVERARRAFGRARAVAVRQRAAHFEARAAARLGG